MLNSQTEVLIVGAGPVGLTAAVVLTQRGHGVTVVDNQTEGASTSRAAVVHPHTLELLEPYGVTSPLVERGVLTVHGKGKKTAELPVPHDVGHAISAYLLRRPRVDARGVFLRVRAPYCPLLGIGQLIFTASQRAGIAPVWPHRLRHTAATEMLRRGASLSDIGDVLRHASTSTTAIYAKVDRRALRALVQPWPGAQQ
jgi:integrase